MGPICISGSLLFSLKPLDEKKIHETIFKYNDVKHSFIVSLFHTKSFSLNDLMHEENGKMIWRQFTNIYQKHKMKKVKEMIELGSGKFYWKKSFGKS